MTAANQNNLQNADLRCGAAHRRSARNQSSRLGTRSRVMVYSHHTDYKPRITATFLFGALSRAVHASLIPPEQIGPTIS
jgi:hypothetical protein